MSAHTPGPWRFNETVERYGTVSADAVGIRIAIICGPERARANARLIAAAPDLLARVQKEAAECEHCRGQGVTGIEQEECEWCADLRALIAKATQP